MVKEEVKTNISIGMMPSLIKRIDEEARSLGLSRSAFLAVCANMYFRNQEATEMLSRASDLFQKAQELQAENQLNLWNKEIEITKS